jgi:uncharacterized protein with NRDE domain
MCTLILYHRPGHDWPLLLATNRDEMIDRPWRPPARHWPCQPDVIAGMDRMAGGSWLGLNDQGVIAAVMNRRGTLGPQTGKRSRGELVLKALAYDSSTVAATALTDLDTSLYQSFNLVVADRRMACWLCHRGDKPSTRIEVHALPSSLTMFTNRDPDDTRVPRIRSYLPRFQDLPAPDPESAGGWSAWTALLSSRSTAAGAGPESAMTVVTDRGYGTVSSSLLALPATRRVDLQPVWLFAAGRPDLMTYESVSL